MNKLFLIILSMLAVTTTEAQVLSLDSCRARALRSNKQMSIARVKKEAAENTRKATKTMYLPRVDVAGGYVYSSREISLLNDNLKQEIGNIGSIVGGQVANKVIGMEQNLSTGLQNFLNYQIGKGEITELQAQKISALAGNVGSAFNAMGGELLTQMAAMGDEIGQRVVDAFRTNTHHMFTATATLTQPVFMGGTITAANKMAEIAEKMANTNIEAKEQDVTYAVDNAYWMVVSLKQKQRLADAYLSLVQKLNGDVHKMIENGVATRADGLKVDVAVNEADMAKAKIDNALTLARMLLCKQCGMPLDSEITLADEDKEDLEAEIIADNYDRDNAKTRRPELQLLSDAVDLTKQQTKIARAGYLPQVALMSAAVFSNPSTFNGFERKFKGAFNVGVMVRIPVLDWGDTMYKIRAAKNATNMAKLQLGEAEEMIDLQISQNTFKVREANKNLANARKNIERAEENLRCATLGFKEGVMQTTDVMAAQTAWLQAQTQKVDAEIDVKLSETGLKKALGLF